MNKRGQFFLIAAFIMVGIILALSAVVNTVIVKEDKEFFYDLSSEVGYETKKVIDYGTYNVDAVPKELTKEFLFDYVNYIGQDSVIFVYADKTDASALVFQQQDVGSIGLNTGEEKIIPIQQRVENGNEAQVLLTPDNKVKITIDEVNHEFKMKDGTDLFYIIMREEDYERLVAEG